MRKLVLVGEVRSLRIPSGPLRTLLLGRDGEGRPTEVALAGASREPLPEILPAVRVEVGDAGVRMIGASGEFDVAAASVHIHRDLSGTLRAVIPPRPVPLLRRLFWGLALTLAASAAGRAVLRRLRARGRPPASVPLQ